MRSEFKEIGTFEIPLSGAQRHNTISPAAVRPRGAHPTRLNKCCVCENNRTRYSRIRPETRSQMFCFWEGRGVCPRLAGWGDTQREIISLRPIRHCLIRIARERNSGHAAASGNGQSNTQECSTWVSLSNGVPRRSDHLTSSGSCPWPCLHLWLCHCPCSSLYQHP